MKIVILAAGYAVRLHPLTLNMPKPLLKIGKKSIIDRIIDKVVELDDVDEIDVVSNGRFFSKFEDWLKSAKHKELICLVNDGTTTNDTRLGAINDLDLVIRERAVSDDLLIVAGDNVFELDMEDFIGFARKNQDGISIAVHDIKEIDAAKNFGVITIDSGNRVVDFDEKPQFPRSTLVSTGIYYFPKKKLSFIKDYVKMANKLDAPGYYISWLSKVEKVYGYKFLEDWCDIGNIESYEKADKKYTEKENRANGKA